MMRSLLKRITGHALFKPFEQEEGLFCEQRLEEKHRALGVIGYLSSIGLMPFFIAATLIWVPEPVSFPLLLGFCSSWVLCSVAAYREWSTGQHLRRCVQLGWISLQSGLSIAYALTRSYDVPAPVLLLIGIALACGGLLTIIYYPGQSKQSITSLGLIIMVSIFGFVPLTAPWMHSFIIVSVMSTGLAYRLFIELDTLSQLRREYASLKATVPTIVLRTSLQTRIPVEILLKPQTMHCVCLSIDWRKYREFASHSDPQVIVMALSEFYDRARSIVARHHPDGNYIFDWMADELLVGVYSQNPEDLNRMTNSMLSTAIDIIATRPECEKLFSYPKAIDIGIASGRASVGLIGKDGFRKATIVGEAPDQARRMQIGGKLLRQRLGQADRIVFEDRLLLLISVPFEVQQLDTSASTDDLSSLIDHQLFFIEPAPVTREDISHSSVL